MAIIEVKIPSPGESITHVEIYKWLVADGDIVKRDTEIAEIESEKATLTLVADDSGKISIKVAEGDSVEVGAVACTIDTSVAPKEEEAPAQPVEEKKEVEKEEVVEPKKEVKTESIPQKSDSEYDKVKTTPVAQLLMEEYNLSIEDVVNGLRRLKKSDIEAVIGSQDMHQSDIGSLKRAPSRNSDSNRMSALRRKLSERLVSVKNETAMLTTFNEVNMKPIMDIRKKHQPAFVEKHGVKLGMMSFFLKACSIALQEYPTVNAMIDEENMVTYDYADISVAVSTPKGLMVPVIRNVESLSLAEIEKSILEVADKARNGKLSIPEMSGGTFTVTNGGVFGSMMSTPIINPPQSAILGMHNIIERPVVIDGEIVARPMMYVALSYDHRVIDGRESVSFLVRVKQLLENPSDMLFGNSNAEKALLDL